jgi:hypothetical protein
MITQHVGNCGNRIKTSNKLGVVVHAYNPSTWKMKEGGFQGQGQPGLPDETLSQKKKKKKPQRKPPQQKWPQKTCLCSLTGQKGLEVGAFSGPFRCNYNGHDKREAGGQRQRVTMEAEVGMM